MKSKFNKKTNSNITVETYACTSCTCGCTCSCTGTSSFSGPFSSPHGNTYSSGRNHQVA